MTMAEIPTIAAKVEPAQIQVLHQHQPTLLVDSLATTVAISEVKNPPGDQANQTSSNNKNLFFLNKMDQLRTSVKEIPKQMGSWTDFFNPKLFSIPSSTGELYERFRNNLRVYYPNYLVVSLILLAWCLFASPLLLIGLAVFGLLTYSIFTRNQSVSLFGQSFTTNQQLIGLTVCSIPFFLLFGLTGIFFWLIGASTCITGLHSVFHQLPQLNDHSAPDSGLSGDVNPEVHHQNGGTFQVVAL